MVFSIIQTNELNPTQHAQIDALWDAEYPVNLNGRLDILLGQNSNYEHFIIEVEGNVIGWSVLFDNEGERRFSIIVDPAFKGMGLGKKLLDSMKAQSGVFYGWVIDHDRDVKKNGEQYLSPIPFYLKNGFEIVPEVRLETPIISAVKIKYLKS